MTTAPLPTPDPDPRPEPHSDVAFPDFDAEKAARMIGHVATVGVARSLHIVVSGAGPGWMRATMPLNDDTRNMLGMLHGGACAALVDHLLGATMYPNLPSGSWAATTSFSINLVKAVKSGHVEATATVVAMSRNTATIRVDVHNVDADGDVHLAAVAQGMTTLKRPAA